MGNEKVIGHINGNRNFRNMVINKYDVIQGMTMVGICPSILVVLVVDGTGMCWGSNQ
jgi:hypothetical protein